MTRLSGESATSPATLPSVSVEPGSLIEPHDRHERRRQQRGRVPVLVPSLYYSTLTPAGSGSPSPSATPTQTASARTPQPTTSTVPGR